MQAMPEPDAFSLKVEKGKKKNVVLMASPPSLLPQKEKKYFEP
jgi:hypothetical protein